MSGKVVSIGDSLLRESDVELLRGPFWLNDNIISFYFEYLSLEKYNDRDDILFVGPEVTHCLKAASVDEIPIFLDPTNAKKKQYIFFAFNDERTFEKCGGTHWSLLIYSKPDKIMYHADSMSGVNFRQAAKFSGKLSTYLSPSGVDFQELDCLQQDNAYDCGIFVLCHSEFFMDYLLESHTLKGCCFLKLSDVSTKRKDILQVIAALQKH